MWVIYYNPHIFTYTGAIYNSKHKEKVIYYVGSHYGNLPLVFTITKCIRSVNKDTLELKMLKLSKENIVCESIVLLKKHMVC